MAISNEKIEQMLASIQELRAAKEQEIEELRVKWLGNHNCYPFDISIYNVRSFNDSAELAHLGTDAAAYALGMVDNSFLVTD